MKKLLAIIFALLMLCACSAEAPEEPQNEQKTNLTEVPEELQNEQNTEADEWGIEFYAVNVTSSGADVVFSQSGGNPTGELNTGSYYRIEKDGKELPYIIEDDIAWTMEAYLIMLEDKVNMHVDWSGLYGELEPGEYTIVKNVMDFRGPGDYDSKDYSAKFIVE